MQRKFDVRLIYVAVSVLVVWLALLGWKSARVLASPVPAVVDASEHGSDIHFEADRSAVVFPGDCVNVAWNTSNIQAVFLGENPDVGVGTATFCGSNPRLRIVFQDGSDNTYELSRDLVFDVTNSLITLTLIYLVAYLLCAYTLVPAVDPGSSSLKRREIRPLTSYRALAAGLVFFYHAPVPVDGILFMLQSNGAVGVTLFFVLSGFLIASRYMDEIVVHTFQWRLYLVRRAARILPIYYTVVIIAALWGEHFNLAHLTLTQAFFPDFAQTGISPAWTLTSEESFYLLLPLILWLCWRTKRPWWMLGGVVVVMYGLGLLLVAANIWTLPFMLTLTIFGRMMTFMIGVGCALINRRWQPGKRAWLLTLVCCAGFFVWNLIVLSLAGNDTIIYGDWVAALLAGGLILSLTSESGWIARALSWGPLVYAGRISFALYLLQLIPPVEQLRNALKPLFGDASNLILYAVVTLACIVLHEVIEKPAHRWILRHFNATGSHVAASVQSI